MVSPFQQSVVTSSSLQVLSGRRVKKPCHWYTLFTNACSRNWMLTCVRSGTSVLFTSPDGAGMASFDRFGWPHELVTWKISVVMKPCEFWPLQISSHFAQLGMTVSSLSIRLWMLWFFHRSLKKLHISFSRQWNRGYKKSWLGTILLSFLAATLYRVSHWQQFV